MIRVLSVLMLALPILYWQIGRGASFGNYFFNHSQLNLKQDNSVSFKPVDISARDERPSDCVFSGRCRG